jgi:hypothetical protein
MNYTYRYKTNTLQDKVESLEKDKADLEKRNQFLYTMLVQETREKYHDNETALQEVLQKLVTVFGTLPDEVN